VVPLRSNARTLVAGGAVAAMRERLKYASLFYDSLLLESGIFRVQAGPTGSSSFIVPPAAEDPPRWQTVAAKLRFLSLACAAARFKRRHGRLGVS
jgi:hypothetical protein